MRQTHKSDHKNGGGAKRDTKGVSCPQVPMDSARGEETNTLINNSRIYVGEEYDRWNDLKTA
jgi:hypothetical protein